MLIAPRSSGQTYHLSSAKHIHAPKRINSWLECEFNCLSLNLHPQDKVLSWNSHPTIAERGVVTCKANPNRKIMLWVPFKGKCHLVWRFRYCALRTNIGLHDMSIKKKIVVSMVSLACEKENRQSLKHKV